MRFQLIEDNRKDYIRSGKNADDYAPGNQALGRNRYERRKRSHVLRSVAEMNRINMNELFKFDLLRVDVKVQGETDQYLVTVVFPGILEYLQKELAKNPALDLKAITSAVVAAFNSDDVRVHCTCPDFKYRHDYWLTQKNLNAGDPQNNPGKGIVNPNDTKGNGCKHVMLVLSNNSWCIKVASVIRNYCLYMQHHEERLFKEVMYPALYGHEYTGEEGVQQELGVDNDNNVVVDTSTELDSDECALDTSNEWAKTKNLFQKGHQGGIQFAKETPKQFSFDSLISDSETVHKD